VAAGLRCFELGRSSFWYDEVVTMRLARAPGPRALLERLFQIDATRAPLYPLILQVWVRIFGTSEAAARSLSVLCGVASIALTYAIGRRTFDRTTGLWAAWLAALSPALIVYGREARMYSWLVLATCLCWLLLLDLTRGPTAPRMLAYMVAEIALVYSHPLGLIMAATLALAGLIWASSCFGSPARWLLVHLGVLFLILPWVGRYLDHPPEFVSGRLSVRSLLGTPIGFVGGNFALLAGLVLLIAVGVERHDSDGELDDSRSVSGASRPGRAFLLLWLISPPSLLYVYSMIGYPVFGPQRYTLFVAPAYLVLVAAGLSRLPVVVRYPVALGLALVSASGLFSTVYDPEFKADWRAFAQAISEGQADWPSGARAVIVASADPARNVEVETARYYLPAGCSVIASALATPEQLSSLDDTVVFYAVAARRGIPARAVPETIGPCRFLEDRNYPGLIVYRCAR
jgi:4-amino-4-deoxy-L-arabinose transferase-like glycosyltransferase